MAAITVYKDEDCTEILGSGFVGKYKRIFGSVPSVYTYFTNVVIDEETIKYNGIWRFNESTYDNITESTRIALIPTDTEQIQYMYFTPECRISFKCWKTGVHSVLFSTGGFQVLVNGTWESAGGYSEMTYSSTDTAGAAFSVSFRTCETAAYNTYGTTIQIDNKNFFCYDLHYYDNQGHEITNRCMNGVAPFEKWYREETPSPYEPDTGTTRRGGTGTGYYPNSVIPALPTGAINSAFSSVLGTGNGLTYYKLTGNSLVEITEFLYDTTLNLKFRNSQYRDAVASVIWIPYNVQADVSNTLGIVYLANKSITVSGGCDFVTTPLKEIDFGEVNLTAGNIGYKGYADYIHTTATLYLPCFGAVNIDMATIANGILHLRGVIDVRNGNILYRLETQGEQDDTPVLYGQYNGNCGIPVPIGGANASPSILGAISSIGTIGVGVATGNPLNIVGGISSLASQTAPDIDTAGAMQPACAALGTPVPILQIKKHVLSAPPDFATITGIPADGSTDGVYNPDIKTLGDYSGYFQAADCDVSGIAGATESEKAEIEMLLKSGVFL